MAKGLRMGGLYGVEMIEVGVVVASTRRESG